MFAIRAQYRGTRRRRGVYVKEIFEAITKNSSIDNAELLDIENFEIFTDATEVAAGVLLNLIQEDQFELGIAISLSEDVTSLSIDAEQALYSPGSRNHPVGVRVTSTRLDSEYLGEDISNVLHIVSTILKRRSAEGREATALMRSGYLQIEAAQALGITKQAMSQRLHAAEWPAEQSGWKLLINTLNRAMGA